ncbi:hypothetical protein [Aeromicrobium sp. UC242_57]|uniref:hypothetical protein n=1 Tax=Aeromicrobium sp. UC242_57 TaxID=3374624 RepID=UPI0037A55EEF
MAKQPQRSSNQPRPKRTLILFLAAVIALYGIVALIDLTNDKDDDSAWHPRLGARPRGRHRISLQAKATDGKVTQDKLDQARSIIDQRVNATGVTEAEVTTQGSDQIIIEIPGERKAGIVDEVGKTAQLRFRLGVERQPDRCREEDRHRRAAEDHRQDRLEQADARPDDQGRDRRPRHAASRRAARYQGLAGTGCGIRLQPRRSRCRRRRRQAPRHL